MKYFLVVLFLIYPFCSQAIDMRALSRQRGYKPYRAGSSSPVTVVTPAPVRRAPPPSAPSAEKQPSPAVSNEEDIPFPPQDAEGEINPELIQTGIKMFQEKDENKILNFNIENPEFKKLNKKQQQDLLNRISYEQSRSR